MVLLDWSPRYSVRIREIDRQHAKLFAQLNGLAAALRDGTKAEVGKHLAHLIAYAHYHFATEERLFAQHAYPDAAAHAAEHRELMERARTYQRRFEAQQPMATSGLLEFFRDWLARHIDGADRHFAAYLATKGVS
jgi:hemerythrin